MSGRSLADELLAQIFERPSDLAPREVYADLLVAEDDPRGVFIHRQLARRDREPDKKERKAELKLLIPNARRWVGDLGGVLATDDTGNDYLNINRLCVGPAWSGDWNVRFERGFLAAVSLRGTTPPEMRARIKKVRTSPWWRTIWEISIDAEHLSLFPPQTLPLITGLTARSDELEAIRDCMWAQQLQRLFVWSSFETVHRDLELIAELPSLRELGLKLEHGAHLGPAHRPVLARLLGIQTLTRVELPHWHITNTTAFNRRGGRWKAENNAVSRQLARVALG